MDKIKVSVEIAHRYEGIEGHFHIPMLIRDVVTAYQGEIKLTEFLATDKRYFGFGELLFKNGFDLEQAIQICFGNFEVEPTPIDKFHQRYKDSKRLNNIPYHQGFVDGMEQVARWFNLPVKLPVKGRDKK